MNFESESFAYIEKSYESEGKWVIEGWASTSEVDSEGLKMSKEALQDMVNEFKVMRTVLHNHNKDEEIGTVLETELKKKSEKPEVWGCWVKVLISKTVPQIWQKIKEGVLNSFSVRGRVKAIERFEGGKVITEAQSFQGAELSVVSVPALRSAKIEEVYVEKLLQSLKEGKMEVKELEKISLKDARDAIESLLENDEKKDEILKILDSVEQPSQEEKVEKMTLEQAKEKIDSLIEDSELKTSVREILDSVVEEKVEKEEKQEEKAERQEQDELTEVVESLAGGLKVLYEKVQAALRKKPEDAFEDLKTIAEQMKRLVEAYPYPYPKGKYPYPYPSKYPYPAKKEEEETEKTDSDELFERFAASLENISKSLEETAKNVRDEQIVKIGEKIMDLEKKIEDLNKTIRDEVPIRKALVTSDKQREVEKKGKDFRETEEYKNATPSEKLRMLLNYRRGLIETE